MEIEEMNEHLKRAICLLMSMLLVFSGIPVYAQEAEQELSSGACVNTPAPELILPDAAERRFPIPRLRRAQPLQKRLNRSILPKAPLFRI